MFDDNNAILSTGEFGEASVNLSTALLAAGFNEDACHSYGSMMVKARSSGSSTDAELNDFIAPVPFHASTCASPSITTTLSSSTGNDGATVHDSAVLGGVAADASGPDTYGVYSDSTCTTKVADGVPSRSPMPRCRIRMTLRSTVAAPIVGRQRIGVARTTRLRQARVPKNSS